MKMGIPDMAEVQESMCNKKTIRQLDDEDEHRKNGLTRVRSSSDDRMSQSVCLFRKYLVRKSRQPNIIGKSNNMEEFKDIKKCWSGTRPPFPSELGRASNSRPPSLLERQVLPGLSSDNHANDHNKASASSQLTIFYAGLINVYEDVPAEKAQAIMLLAGSSSLSKAVTTETPPPPAPPKTDVRVKAPLPPAHPSSPQSLPDKLKAHAGLVPIARRYSLQCFLEKRRGRIINKSPYAPPTTAAHAE